MTTHISQWLRWCWYRCLMLSASVVIVLAVLFSLLRLSLPYLDDYQRDISHMISQRLNHPLTLESMDVSWQGLHPRLHFHNVNIQNNNDGQLQSEDIVVSFDVIKSLLTLSLRLHEVHILGVDLQIKRKANGDISINHWLLPLHNDNNNPVIIPDMLNGVAVYLQEINIVLDDASKNKQHVFDKVSISAKSDNKHHQLFLSTLQPSVLGKRFELGLDVNGQLNQLNALKGEVYLNFESLDIEQIRDWYDKPLPLQAGIVNAEVWFDIGDGKSDSEGRLHLENIVLDGQAFAGTVFESIKGNIAQIDTIFYLAKQSDQWNIYVPALDFYGSDKIYHYQDLTLQLKQDFEFMLRYKSLPLDDTTQLLKHLPLNDHALTTKLENARVDGVLKNGFLYCHLKIGLSSCLGYSDFNQLAFYYDQQQPSFNGLSGKLQLRENKVHIALDSRDLQLELLGIFRRPLDFQRVNADVSVSLDKKIITVRNMRAQARHVTLLANADIVLPKPGDKGRLRLNGQLIDMDISGASMYYPVSVMKKPLVNWLDMAIRYGHIPQADILIDGPLHKTLFKKPEYVFQITGKLQNGNLQFHSNWPMLENFFADIAVVRNGIYVYAEQATSKRIKMTQGHIWINDYRDKYVQVDVQTAGQLSAVQQLIQHSPLKRRMGTVIDDLIFSGQQQGWLSAEIPWEKKLPLFLEGEMQLTKAALAYPVADINISHIPAQQSVFFTERGFASQPFAAELNAHTAEMIMLTESDLATGKIIANTHMSLDKLLPDPQPSWLKDIKGETDWLLTLNLPLVSSDSQHPSLNVCSDLQGVYTNLPEPLSKPAKQALDAEIELVFLHDKKALLYLREGNSFRGQAKVNLQNKALNILAADVTTNPQQTLSLNDKSGIYLQAYLPDFNLDQWLAYVKQQSGQGHNTFQERVQSVQLQLDRLTYLDRTFKQAHIQLQQKMFNWHINIQQAAINGDVFLPKQNIIKQGIKLHLDSLDFNIMPEAESPQVSADPEAVPLVQLSASKVLLSGYEFDNVELTTARVGQNLLITSLTTGHPSLQIKASGIWRKQLDDKQHTRLSGVVTAENLGKGLNKLGYAALIKDGKGEVEFDINWSGSPIAFAVSNLQGYAHGRFENGEIIEVDPGASGRLFSLISLQALPRRLAFDFKDLSSRGFYFNKMHGRFEFKNGIAHTDDFTVKGSVGRIRIEGDTDINKKRYDQSVKFTPDLSSSLPVIGTVLGGPTAGIGIIIVDRIARLFGKQVDDIAEFKYTVTGSWDEPVIESAKRKKQSKQLTKKEIL